DPVTQAGKRDGRPADRFQPDLYRRGDVRAGHRAPPGGKRGRRGRLPGVHPQVGAAPSGPGQRAQGDEADSPDRAQRAEAHRRLVGRRRAPALRYRSQSDEPPRPRAGAAAHGGLSVSLAPRVGGEGEGAQRASTSTSSQASIASTTIASSPVMAMPSRGLASWPLTLIRPPVATRYWWRHEAAS